MERPAWTITFGVFGFFTSFVFVCGVFYWWKANAEDGLNTNASLYFFIWLIWIDFGLVWIDVDLIWIGFSRFGFELD